MSTRRAPWKTVTLCLLISLAPIASAAKNTEPALSTAQAAIVSKQIATLRSPGDRKVAQGWSNAKKVAELICRPVALSVLKKQTQAVDRVFLGTDAPQSLNLENNKRLSGNGEFRTPHGWQDFTFTCDLNPTTGQVIRFQTTPR